jgi:hypothetical protein
VTATGPSTARGPLEAVVTGGGPALARWIHEASTVLSAALSAHKLVLGAISAGSGPETGRDPASAPKAGCLAPDASRLLSPISVLGHTSNPYSGELRYASVSNPRRSPSSSSGLATLATW